MTESPSGTFRFVTSRGPGNPCVNAIAVEGACLAAAADDGRVRILNYADRSASIQEIITPRGARVLANAIDIFGDMVVVGNHHGQILRLLVGSTGAEQAPVVELGAGPVNAVAISPDCDRIIVGCYEGSISILGPSNDAISQTSLGRGAIKSIAMADSDTVVVGTAGGDLGRFELNSGRVEWLPGHDAIVNDIALGPDRRTVVSVSRDFTIRWTDIWTGEVRGSASLDKRSPKAVLQKSVDTAYVADYWGWVTIVDTSGRVLASRRVSTSGVSSLARVDFGIVAGSYDGSLKTLDPVSLKSVGFISLAENSDIDLVDGGPA